MLVNVGFGSLFLAFILCLYAVGAALYGLRSQNTHWLESARHAMQAVFPTVSFAVTGLLLLILGGHFEVAYVSSVSSTTMPIYLKITSLWGGQAGSLLFWTWLMSAFAFLVTLHDWRRDRDLLPWVIVIICVTIGFFLMLNIAIENPFNKLWIFSNGEVVSALFSPAGARIFVPREGAGMNPLLRHPGMILHPPILYIGFVSFVVPYAFAMAALITGRTDDRWIRISRRWTLVAWLFLSLGLLLGARWAYDVLGWGGYWGWDPVEIAAFIPWLSGTAFLHSAIMQERRNMLKRWNVLLIILTYALVIFGTFLTRSGVLSSVHAFAQSAIGPLFFIYIGVAFIISIALLQRRWNELDSGISTASFFSRESLFLYNNFLFLGVLVVCLWGMLFPLISEIFTGQKVTVGPPFYEMATGPIFAAILLIMGVAPLSAWGASGMRTFGRALWKPAAVALLLPAAAFLGGMRAWPALLAFWLIGLVCTVILFDLWRSVRVRMRQTGEPGLAAVQHHLARNRRRYGGYLVHLGVVFIAMGVIGIEMYQQETQGTIPQGSALTLSGYSFLYQDLAIFDTFDGRNIARAVVSVSKDGTSIAELYPRRDFYYDAQQPITIPGLYSSWLEDLYVILVDWQPISSRGATFKIYRNPLVAWLWFGGLVFIIGTLVSALPSKLPQPFKQTDVSLEAKGISDEP